MFLGEKNTGVIGKFNQERSFILSWFSPMNKTAVPETALLTQFRSFGAKIILCMPTSLLLNMASSYLQLTSFCCGTIPVLGL